MANLVVPFDNNPVSTTIKTTSYTIPAGKYARVKPLYADFTLNGTTMFMSQSISTAAVASGATVTNSAGFTAEAGSVITGGFLTQSLNGLTSSNGGIYLGTSTNVALATASRTTAGTTSLTTPLAIAGTTFFLYAYSSSSGTSTTTVGGTLWVFAGKSTEFWLPSGSVLTGSKYLVEEYNVIS